MQRKHTGNYILDYHIIEKAPPNAELVTRCTSITLQRLFLLISYIKEYSSHYVYLIVCSVTPRQYLCAISRGKQIPRSCPKLHADTGGRGAHTGPRRRSQPGESCQYTIICLATVCTCQLASYTAITIVCEPLLIQLAALFQVNENGAVVEVP